MGDDLPAVGELSKGLTKGEERRFRRFERLEARARPLHELVHEGTYRVTSVGGFPYNSSPSQQQTALEDGPTREYPQASRASTLLEIEAREEGNPAIKRLVFTNYSPVMPGDTIRVKVPLHYKIFKPDKTGFIRAPNCSPPHIYVARKAEETEFPFELTIVNRHGSRTDISPDFRKYQAKD